MGKKEDTNSIIEDSYYLINLFHKEYKKVTQLHVQILMFLFEAYYMNVMDKDYLYKCEYRAWSFGAMTPIIYKRYKNCGEKDIILTDEEIKKGCNISNEKKELMYNLYGTFKDLSAIELISFIRSINSPWRNVWEKEPYGNISKTEMRKWFENYIK